MKLTVAIAIALLAVIAASSVWTLATVRQQECVLENLRLSGNVGPAPGRVQLGSFDGRGGTSVELDTYVTASCKLWGSR